MVDGDGGVCLLEKGDGHGTVFREKEEGVSLEINVCVAKRDENFGGHSSKSGQAMAANGVNARLRVVEDIKERLVDILRRVAEEEKRIRIIPVLRKIRVRRVASRIGSRGGRMLLRTCVGKAVKVQALQDEHKMRIALEWKRKARKYLD